MDQALASFKHQSENNSADFSFEVLSLSFVRTVAVIAVEKRNGILWGNDLIKYPGYLPQDLTLES
jgi:hypothetical protein